MVGHPSTSEIDAKPRDYKAAAITACKNTFGFRALEVQRDRLAFTSKRRCIMKDFEQYLVHFTPLGGGCKAHWCD